jgi:2'-5' RNA ligase
MNLFLAIEPPEEIKQQVFFQLKDLREEYKSFNWIEQQNYHITLHYFGAVVNRQALIQKINKLIYDQKKLYLFSRGLDFFMRHRISIYLSFYRNKQLEKMADTINYGFNDRDITGFSFIPHLSIGNCRIPAKQQYLLLKKKIANFKLTVEFAVENIYLYASIIKGSVITYQKLEQFSLL